MTWTCFDGERKGTRHTHPRAFALMVTSSWMLFPEFSMWLFPSGHSGLSLNMPSLQRLPWLHRHSFLPNFYFLCSILHDLILFYWLICLLDTSVQFSSVAQSCPTLCDPRDWSMQGLPVHHQLPEFTQTHVHWTGDAIQPSHPLSSTSPPTFNLSQHQGLFKWVSSSHKVAKVLEFQFQHQSFQWTFKTDFLWDGLVGSPCSPRDSQESSPIPQFKSISTSALSFHYSPTLTSIHDYWKNHSLD